MRRAASWSVHALSVAVLLALPATVLATYPGQNGRILFVSGRSAPDFDESGADVYILDHPGGAALPVAYEPGQHRHPAWSPDLTRIAYALKVDPQNWKIWIQEVGNPSAVPVRLSSTSISVQEDNPSWSPDGKRIAYESEVTDGSGQSDILITTIGGATINLTDSPTQIEGGPIWSRDGKTMYYSRRGIASTDDDILSEASDNSSPFVHFLINTAAAEYQPGLSPDGSKLCYTKGAYGSPAADVYVVASSGFGEPVDISDTTLGAYNCAWSPNGRYIAYSLGTFSNAALTYELADDSGTPTPLAVDTPNHFDGNPDWAPLHPALCGGRPATITGTDHRDTLKGTRHRDVIAAFGGDDSVKGGAGNDLICGGKGNDALDGGAGNDRLFGGTGTDTCIGGPGTDVKAGCER